MDLIFLLAPTSTDERMQQVARVASGYVYYVSLKGVTGSGALDTDAVEAMLPRIRQHVSVPVGVGFGIRDAATAKTISKVADAVVIRQQDHPIAGRCSTRPSWGRWRKPSCRKSDGIRPKADPENRRRRFDG